MMKKTHIAAGVGLGGLVAATAGVVVTPLFLCAAALGGIFPDLDHPSASLNQKVLLVNSWLFKAITYVGMAIVLYMYGGRYLDKKLIIFLVALLIAVGFSRHRSVTHSLTAVIFILGLFKYLKLKYGIDLVIPFVSGYISHIIIDMFNPQGVELLWPYKKHIRMPITVETGGLGESIIFISFIGTAMYLVLKMFNLI